MKILVTGANGFVGKNLITTLENIRDGKDKSRNAPSDIEIFKYDIGTPEEDFKRYCRECDFVFNLVGVHRPKDPSEFMKGNFGFLSTLLETLESCSNTPRIMFSSSIQALLENPYGESKRAAEKALFEYSERTGAEVYVYRFTNLFGKWSRPNYNSVVSTFCHNIANDLPIQIRDREYEMELLYIDDVVDALLEVLSGRGIKDGEFYTVPVTHKITLGELADTIYSFKQSRETKQLTDFTDGGFEKKLYSTYLSYLPTDEFSYPLKMNVDNRGSFTEILRTLDRGQFSVNISKPHITKGEHWHHTKNEKFLVVSGTGVIRFRKVGEEKIYEYFVSGDKLEVVDIPTGYTHNIENLGDTDMVTFMWCNECFNPEKPDTYFLPVGEISEKKPEKEKILVLGGAGMAGHVIAYYFKKQGYEVKIFDRRSVDGFDCIIGDATNAQDIKQAVLEKPYKAVINCIGLLNRACDENVGLAAYLNGYLPHYIEDLLKNTSTKLMHISSDCIFQSRDTAYSENDIPDATDMYGKTKAVGEVNNSKDITFRTSIVGPDIDEKKGSLFNWFMAQNEAVGFTKVMWTGVSTITLARAMKKALDDELCGVYHLVNNETISKHDLLELFNGIRENKIEITADDSRELRKTLVNNRTDFDFTVPSYSEMVNEIKEWIETHKDLYKHYSEV